MRLMNQSYQLGKKIITPVYGDGHLWVTSKQIGVIVDITQRVVNHHLSDLKKSGRIGDDTTVRVHPTTRKEGGRDVTRVIKHYSERVVFLVALRSSSDKAADFQEWVLDVLSELRQKGVVYANPQLRDNNQDVTELQAKVLQLQGIINECHMDMNEGLVPWFGGELPKRVTYLIGSQKGVRPRARQPMPPVLPQPLSDKLLRIMRSFHDRNNKWPTLSEMRTRTGNSGATRQSKDVMSEELNRMEVLGQIQRDDSGRSIRYRII